MPDKIKGKKLTRKQHRQWKKVFAKTGSGARATAAVKKGMKPTRRKKP